MNTHEQRKLSESLLDACKAAGIKDPKYIAQDRNRDIYHFNEKPIVSTAQCFWFGDNEDGFYLDHPPYATDWQESLLEWVEPQVENFNITKAAAMAKWRESFGFTETEKQQIEDYAVAENEPIANVLARHPESFTIETERNNDGEPVAHFIRNHHGDITEMIRPDHVADTSKMIDPYKVQVGGVTLDPYMIASIYGINDPIIFQMLKKLLRFGRKHKDAAQDVVDTVTSAIRWLEINAPESEKTLIEAMTEKGDTK